MKIVQNQDGFSALEALLILVIVVIIGFVGWYVWKNKNKLNTAKVPTISSTSTSSTHSISTTTQKPPTQSTTTTGQYAGWESYTLKYEKINFKYPPDWKVTDTSSVSDSSSDVSPGQDAVTIKSNNALEISIQTGNVGVDYGCPSDKVLSSTPLNLLGTTYYLNFVGGCDENSPPNNNVFGASLYTTASALYPYPSSKNIGLSSTGKAVPGGLSQPINDIVLTYDTTNPSYPVSHFQQDINYATAIKILESMSY